MLWYGIHWDKIMTVRAYVAHAMTSRTGNVLWSESESVLNVFSKYHISVYDPVIIENIPRIDEPVPNKPGKDGLHAWNNDKLAIRRSHVLVDVTPELKSEGVHRELGYSRFFLWKPTIRVYKPGSDPHMVTIFEDDVITFSLEDAAQIINERWGTWPKRIIWRLKMLVISLPKFLLYQIQEFK